MYDDHAPGPSIQLELDASRLLCGSLPRGNWQHAGSNLKRGVEASNVYSKRDIASGVSILEGLDYTPTLVACTIINSMHV